MSTSKNGKSGVYFVVIDGLPGQWTWQDLKDFVRQETEHEFWADLKSLFDASGFKRGGIRTQRPKDANSLYKFLVRASIHGRRLGVVLWDISQSPPKQLAPNPSQAMTGDQAKWASEVANGTIGWPSVMPTQAMQQPTAAQANLVQSMEKLSLQQCQQQQAAYYAQIQQQQKQAQAQAAQQMQQLHAAYYASQVQQPARRDSVQTQAGASRPPPEYLTSYTGAPVNGRDGVALIVYQGVFVSGINYKAREEDIKHKFSSVGQINKLSLQTDASTGKSKGVATILYSSAGEAQKARDRYDGAVWMDKKMRVRIDREGTTLAAPPRSDTAPLIVNGSSGR